MAILAIMGFAIFFVIVSGFVITLFSVLLLIFTNHVYKKTKRKVTAALTVFTSTATLGWLMSFFIISCVSVPIAAGLLFEKPYDVQIPFFEVGVNVYNERFKYKGEQYVKFNAFESRLIDIQRGFPLTNSIDSVVFGYFSPTNHKLLCIRDEVYCKASDIGELTQFYDNYDGYKYNIFYGQVYEKVDFPDKYYAAICAHDPQYVKKSTCHASGYDFFLDQTIPCATFSRTIEVTVEEDGDIYISVINGLFSSREETIYSVIDDGLYARLNELGKQVKHAETEYQKNHISLSDDDLTAGTVVTFLLTVTIDIAVFVLHLCFFVILCGQKSYYSEKVPRGSIQSTHI